MSDVRPLLIFALLRDVLEFGGIAWHSHTMAILLQVRRQVLGTVGVDWVALEVLKDEARRGS